MGKITVSETEGSAGAMEIGGAGNHLHRNINAQYAFHRGLLLLLRNIRIVLGIYALQDVIIVWQKRRDLCREEQNTAKEADERCKSYFLAFRINVYYNCLNNKEYHLRRQPAAVCSADRKHGWGMRKEKKNSSKRFIIVIFATIAVVTAAIVVYMNRLSATLTQSTLASVQELMIHDMQNIESNMDVGYRELEAILNRLKFEEEQSVSDMLLALGKEQSVSSFELLYLVDDRGTTYSNFNLISDSASLPYIQRVLNQEERFVMYYCGNTDDYTIMQRNRIVYGISSEPMRVDDINIVGIVGMTDVSMMEDRLNVDSFDGRGFTGLIDEEGYFIVNVDRTNSLGVQDNIFNMLAEGQLRAGDSIEEVKERISSGDFQLVQYEDKNGIRQILASVRIPDSEWIILMQVEMAVFEEQSFAFTMMAVILLVVVTGALMVMLFIIMRNRISSSRAEADSKAKGDFLSSMSHEIRTPLNGLLGLLHLMRQNRDNPEKLEDYLAKSASTAQYLLALVNDILDMQKLSQQSMKLQKEAFSLQNLIDTIETLISNRMETNGIRFRVDSQLARTAIVGDKVRIEQILMNILGNAAKFTPAGGSVVMTVRQRESGEGRVTTVFQITDTGCGMSEEFQKHIFESFSQERSKTSDGTRGTGLGMAISKQLSELMEGTLSVVSQKGKGSTFTFELPAAVAEQPDTEDAPGRAVQAADGNKTEIRRILAAEDNELNAEILMEIFTEAGYRIDRARDGREAVELFMASEPGEYDVILMDVQMPVMDGYAATAAIRALDRADAEQVKIFACTANTFAEDRDRALQSGMDDFITKPIDIRELLQKLNADAQ